MEERIVKNLMLRSGMDGKEELLKDLTSDCITELKNYLNYGAGDTLPDGCIPIVKQMVLIKYNQDGVEGIQSEGNSGVSTTYLADLPPALMRQIRKYRKLPGHQDVN